MTDNVEIMIPILHKTFKSNQDWKDLIEHARGQLEQVKKPDADLEGFYSKALLKTGHFKNKKRLVLFSLG